jgi:hypothetical protein
MSDLLEAIAAEFAELRRQAAAERSANAVGDESEDPDLEDVLEAADRHCAAALIEPGPCVGCIEAKRCAHELLACATFTDFVKGGARLSLAVMAYFREQAALGHQVVAFGAVFDALQSAGELSEGSVETMRKRLYRALQGLIDEGLLRACQVPKGYRIVVTP